MANIRVCVGCGEDWRGSAMSCSHCGSTDNQDESADDAQARRDGGLDRDLSDLEATVRAAGEVA